METDFLRRCPGRDRPLACRLGRPRNFINLFGGEGAQNIAPILEQLQQQQSTEATAQPLSAEDEKMGQFVSTVLADTEDVWHRIFKENGMTYEEPGMVLFRGSVQSACGGATSASGPFYCPGDEKVYMDLSFFNEFSGIELQSLMYAISLNL